jgi:hypothetical protein
VTDGEEAEVVQLILTTVGDRDLGGTLEGEVAVIRWKDVSGETFD